MKSLSLLLVCLVALVSAASTAHAEAGANQTTILYPEKICPDFLCHLRLFNQDDLKVHAYEAEAADFESFGTCGVDFQKFGGMTNRNITGSWQYFYASALVVPVTCEAMEKEDCSNAAWDLVLQAEKQNGQLVISYTKGKPFTSCAEMLDSMKIAPRQ
jgi:hypothetical protein